MEEIIFASATTLAQAIRTKKVSSVEVVEAFIRRIEAVNPQLNAVVQLPAEAALEAARAADAALARGDIKGVLHGVPMTVKDSIETAGVISTSGTLGRKNFVPQQDAVAVARLKAAGAILLGKTNLPEVLMGYESDNLVYGRTNNPYDLSRTCGGSSGGEAAIQAAGGSAIGLGSDSGGSIRIPAHFCGIASIKPTFGRVARTGVFPPYGGMTDRMSHVGVMARQVEDLALGLPLISGVDWRDQSVVPMPLGDAFAVDIKGLQAAFYTDNGITPVTAETAATIKAAAHALEHAGAIVSEDLPAAIGQTMEIAGGLFNPDGGARIKNAILGLGASEISPLVARQLDTSPPLSGSEIMALMSRWDMFRNAMLPFIEKYDVIVCPTCAVPAIPHGTSQNIDKALELSYVMSYNLTGWPAVIVRGGTSPEGLPIGVQVVAKPWREDVAIAVAAQLEAALGGWQKPSL